MTLYFSLSKRTLTRSLSSSFSAATSDGRVTMKLPAFLGWTFTKATSSPFGGLQKVRGVGFEPTKAYATGFPRSPVIPRDHLSLAPSDFEVARSCPLDLVPAWLVQLARDSGTPAHQLVSLLTQQNITPSNFAASLATDRPLDRHWNPPRVSGQLRVSNRY